MAIYGIGANFGGSDDVSKQFIKREVACLGYSKEDSPTLHTMLAHIKTGDIIFIKSFPPNIGLIIKAVGVVVGDAVVEDRELRLRGVRMKWAWHGDVRLGKLEDKYDPVRGLTLYEEQNFTVQSQVIQLLLNSISSAPAQY